jgi:hypothetical protein
MATQEQGATAKSDAYTMRRALKDARDLLSKEFGEPEQEAAVALATFLYGVHTRDEFMRARHEENDIPYGGPG